MRRIKLTVAYEGTDYCGWQVQPNGTSVQSVLDRALSTWLGEEIRTIGASRTDAGVHALGNVAVFDTEARMPGEKFAYALNTRLPEDIRIQESAEVPSEFHPRFTKTIKTYEYKILNRRFPDPLRRRDSFFWYGSLDLEKMKEAALCIEGTHDFRSFAAAGGNTFENGGSTVRTVYKTELWNENDMIHFRITEHNLKPVFHIFIVRYDLELFRYLFLIVLDPLVCNSTDQFVRILSGTIILIVRFQVKIRHNLLSVPPDTDPGKILVILLGYFHK